MYVKKISNVLFLLFTHYYLMLLLVVGNKCIVFFLQHNTYDSQVLQLELWLTGHLDSLSHMLVSQKSCEFDHDWRIKLAI